MVEESTHEGPASTMLVVAFLPLPCIQTHLTEVTDIMGAYQSASDELEPFEHFVFASEERLRQGRPSLQANNTCFGWHKQVRMADCRTREETSDLQRGCDWSLGRFMVKKNVEDFILGR